MHRFVLLLCLLLAACGGGSVRPPNHAAINTTLECAPFARALTGVSLRGSAADWWPQAQGRYERTQTPEVGGILVFRRTGHMPNGHVAVVSKVSSPRQIMVTHANWLPHRVTEDQPIIDVSQNGDWSAVQVWWPPAGQVGGTYQTFGFILPDHPAEHDGLVAATPAAIRVAQNGR